MAIDRIKSSSVQETPLVTDGRAQRSLRSREKLIDALISLVEEGHLVPTGQEIADRAGMNLRTVFRHFEDIESLFAAIHERLEPILRAELYEGPPTGSLPVRLRGFVKLRARAFERIAPFQRSGRLQRWGSPELQQKYAVFVEHLRQNMREILPEVDDLPPAVFAAVEALTSFETWDRMRSEQELGPRQAADAIEAALTRLIA